MEENSKVKRYRIGDYAAYMGVTPDFLKYYENFRIVTPEIRSNGYRYYPFSQSPKILECMRLRNYGIPIRDMDQLLNSSEGAEAKEALDAMAEEMERRIRLEQAVLEEHRRFNPWLSRMLERSRDWQIREMPELYFLPHSNGYDFLDDDRIYAILKDWVGWMPLAKSCLKTTWDSDTGEQTGRYWGIALLKSDAEKYEIPINSAVERVPARKAFLYSFSRSPANVDMEEEVLGRLKQMGLRSSGTIYQLLLMYTHMDEKRERYGYCVVPLADGI